jgi:hypothetical protein
MALPPLFGAADVCAQDRWSFSLRSATHRLIAGIPIGMRGGFATFADVRATSMQPEKSFAEFTP